MSELPDVLLLDQVVQEAENVRPAFHDAFDRDSFDSDVTLRVASDDEEALTAIADAEIAVGFDLTEAQLDAADALRWVHALNAGVDSYPVEALADRGVMLTNSSGIHREQIGQQVLASLLYFERRIYEGLRQQRAGEWDRYFAGELGDETVGIVGLGAIGSRVGEFAKGFGSTVVGTKRDPSTAPDCADECYPPGKLDAVLDRADYLVLACPLTDETEGLIGTDELARLDDDAVLINIARGPIVDQDALVEALRADAIRGAALDVSDPEPMPAESPLRSMATVLMTPHVAGTTPYYFERAMDLFADNYRAYVAGEGMENRVV